MSFALLLALLAPCQAPPAPERASYRAHLAAAHGALRLGEPDALRRWLDGAPVDARGFECSYDKTVAIWDALTLAPEERDALRAAITPHAARERG